ncbi:hypothetical protein [Streptomyces dioscori]|uniref:hypothetical protein n=1 Tax=Streptomyces dioscori TaxID=2109333 RepID=UPI001CEC3A5E|nr:hypothetical protein [Streptomyces dioscori]
MTRYRALHPFDTAGRLTRFALGAAADVTDAVIRALTAAVVDRMDLDELVSRVDVNQVAERVDVDRIAARLDLDAVLDRIDLAALTKGVLTEIDLGRIVRDTGGGMADETVHGLRARSVRADRMVDRIADRLLRRPDPEQGDEHEQDSDTGSVVVSVSGSGSPGSSREQTL